MDYRLPYYSPLECTSIPSAEIETIREQLELQGIVRIQLETVFTNSEFFDLMSILGTPIPETSSTPQQYVEEDVILNIKTAINADITTATAPFSTASLPLHIERSTAPLEEQPNYLGLWCVTPPAYPLEGQTVVYSMNSALLQFTDAEQEVMQHIYPLTGQAPTTTRSVNPLLTLDPKRNLRYLSLHSGCTQYQHAHSEELIQALSQKIKRVLESSEHTFSLPWDRQTLFIFDNKKYFHGRTAQSQINLRHLKRIRII